MGVNGYISANGIYNKGMGATGAVEISVIAGQNGGYFKGNLGLTNQPYATIGAGYEGSIWSSSYCESRAHQLAYNLYTEATSQYSLTPVSANGRNNDEIQHFQKYHTKSDVNPFYINAKAGAEIIYRSPDFGHGSFIEASLGGHVGMEYKDYCSNGDLELPKSNEFGNPQLAYGARAQTVFHIADSNWSVVAKGEYGNTDYNKNAQLGISYSF